MSNGSVLLCWEVRIYDTERGAPRHLLPPMTANAAFTAGVQAFRDGKYNEAVEKFSSVRTPNLWPDRVPELLPRQFR